MTKSFNDCFMQLRTPWWRACKARDTYEFTCIKTLLLF